MSQQQNPIPNVPSEVPNVPHFYATGLALVGDVGEVNLYLTNTTHTFKGGQASPENQFVCRLTLNPVVAKALLKAVSGYVDDYEERHGPIPDVPGNALKSPESGAS